jgi:hypothetical protein
MSQKTVTYNLSPQESQSIANFVAAEMNWKTKLGHQAQSQHPIIKKIIWDQANLDVDIYYNCNNSTVQDLDTLKIWLEQEALFLGFCYSLRVIS